MLSRFRPSPAMIVACIALAVALGGSASAAIIISSNSQVAKDTIAGHKPPRGDHSNIIAGSVTGKDVVESSLGVVPRAKNGAYKIYSQPPADNVERTIFKSGQLTITAKCRQPSDTFLTVTFKSSVLANLNFGYIQGSDPSPNPTPLPVAHAGGRVLMQNQDQSLQVQGAHVDLERIEGPFIYQEGPTVITVNLHMVATNHGICQLCGTAVLCS